MPVPNKTGVISRPSLLKDQVYERLESAIISGELAPSTPVVESDALERFDATRATLREAVRKLAYEGTLTVVPQLGTRVLQLERRTVLAAIDVYEAITLASILVLSEEQFAVAANTLAAHPTEVPGSPDSLRTLTDLDRVLRAVVAASGNSITTVFHEKIGVHIRRAAGVTRHPRLAEINLAGLREALLARDPEATSATTQAILKDLRDAVRVAVPEVDPNFTPVKQSSRRLIKDEVYAEIQAAIADGELLPGEVLDYGSLMTWLGVSRAPIRDALAGLETAGLVVAVPSQHTRVANVSAYRAAEIIFSQQVFLELAIRDSADKLGATDQQEASRLISRMAAAAQADDRKVFARELGKYSMLFAKSSENRVLQRVTELCNPQIAQAINRPESEISIQIGADFLAEVEACRASGDVEAAVDRIRAYRQGLSVDMAKLI